MESSAIQCRYDTVWPVGSNSIRYQRFPRYLCWLHRLTAPFPHFNCHVFNRPTLKPIDSSRWSISHQPAVETKPKMQWRRHSHYINHEGHFNPTFHDHGWLKRFPESNLVQTRNFLNKEGCQVIILGTALIRAATPQASSAETITAIATLQLLLPSFGARNDFLHFQLLSANWRLILFRRMIGQYRIH